MWIDEAVFSLKKFKPTAFAPKADVLDYRPLKKKPDYVAVVAAISEHRGFIAAAGKVK